MIWCSIMLSRCVVITISHDNGVTKIDFNSILNKGQKNNLGKHKLTCPFSNNTGLKRTQTNEIINHHR